MDKRGVSIIIGYVLLVVFAMAIGTFVYQSMRTYVPTDAEECPEGVSLFIKNIDHDENQLNITILNNGLFNVAGYYIRATTDSTQELATTDLSPYLNEPRSQANVVNNAILFLGTKNALKPNQESVASFDLEQTIYSIEITPVRFQTKGNTYKLLNCGGSKIKEKF